MNNNQSISAVTPTIVLGTKESYFFQVKYNNMKACSVSYELTEQGSGEISPEGIYTAPAKEGVYEIRIYCTGKPLICTYAYAIVKKKALNEASAPAAAAGHTAEQETEETNQREAGEGMLAGLDLKKGLL